MDNHPAQKSVAERGGTPPPLKGQNPLSSFWRVPLCIINFWTRLNGYLSVFEYKFIGRNWRLKLPSVHTFHPLQLGQMWSTLSQMQKYLWSLTLELSYGKFCFHFLSFSFEHDAGWNDGCQSLWYELLTCRQLAPLKNTRVFVHYSN